LFMKKKIVYKDTTFVNENLGLHKLNLSQPRLSRREHGLCKQLYH